MKTRSGFVSNSSVSSFIICGIYDSSPFNFTKEKIKSLLNEEDYKKFEELFEKDIENAMDFIYDKLEIGYHIEEYREEEIYFGYKNYSENYSLSEMKELIEKTEKIFGENATIFTIVNTDN